MWGLFQEFCHYRAVFYPHHLPRCKLNSPSDNTEIAINPNNQDAINQGGGEEEIWAKCQKYQIPPLALSHASTITQLRTIEA